MARNNPFVGPKPLGARDPLYGRDRELRELRNLLTSERIVVLHSPSGAGKTSLINGKGGLIDTLDARFDVWVPAKLNALPAAGNRALPNRFLWSAMYEFERQFNKGEPAEPPQVKTLKEYVDLRRQPRKPTVLIFDQFEDILRLDPLMDESKREFLTQIGEVLLDDYVWALFALREDYLPPLEPYRRLIPTHLRNRYRLDLLEPAEARLAMVKTAEAGERRLTDDAADQLKTDLSTTEVAGKKITTPVQPLILQVTCHRLWQEVEKAGGNDPITVDDVTRFGKVREALSEYYANSVSAIAGNDLALEWAIRDWCGEKLIAAGGIRSQAQSSDGGLEPFQVEPLETANIVIRDERGFGSAWYELSHDRLIEAILQNNEKRAGAADFSGHYARNLAALSGGDHHRERLIRNWVEDLIQNSNQQAGDLDPHAIEGLLKCRLIRKRPDGGFELTNDRLKRPLLQDNEKWREANLQPFQKLAWIWRRDKPKGLLIDNGARLREARTWAKDEPLQDFEEKFLEESAERLSSKRKLWFWIFAAFFATTVASVIADIRRCTLKRGAKTTLSQAAGGAAGRLANTRLDLASLLAVQAIESADTFEARDAMMSVHQKQPELIRYLPLPAASELAVSSDGSIVAAVNGNSILLLNDKAPLRTETHVGVTTLTFRPRSRTLASGSADKSVRLWKLDQPGAFEKLDVGGVPVRTVFSPDGKLLAVAIAGEALQLWAMADKAPAAPLRVLPKTASANKPERAWLSFNHDGSILAVALDDGSVSLWDVQAAMLLATIPPAEVGELGLTYGVEFHARLNLLAIASDKQVRLFDTTNAKAPRQAMKIECPQGVSSVAFDASHDLLAVGGDDREVRLWKMDVSKLDAQPVGAAFRGHRSAVTRILFAGNDRMISSSLGRDGGILWSLTPPPPLPAGGDAVAYQPKTGNLAVATGTRIVMAGKTLWEDPTGAHGMASKLFFHRDQTLLVSVHMDGLTMLFDSAGRGSATIAGPGSSGVGIAFHPSKRILAAPCDTNAEWAFCLWDVSDLAKPRRIDISQPPAGNGRTISALSFSADGNTLASADSSDEIKLWNVADPQKLHPINSHRTGSKEGVVDLAFHPDANVLAYACEDGSISYLDLDKMKIRDAAATHTSRVFQLAFSPNGKVLASAGEDRTVILWDYQKGEQLGEPWIGHVASVAGVAFKGDGTELASVDNGSLRVWNVSPGVKRICERAGRNLSGEEWKQYIGHDVTYRKTCEAQPANSDVEPVSFWKSLGAFIERQADKCDWCR